VRVSVAATTAVVWAKPVALIEALMAAAGMYIFELWHFQFYDLSFQRTKLPAALPGVKVLYE